MARVTVAGIDLGTTRTVVASASIQQRRPEIVALRQFVSATEVTALESLASVLYAPLADEIAHHPLGGAWVIGEFAQRRASETAGRAVLSAKSWLSHAGVDRTQAILPWPASTELPQRLSPLEASQRVLEHVKRCWNEQFPDSALAQQLVILTVPASFDQVARQLTLQAAANAGLAVRLLEEPIAAFYAFLERTSETELEQLLGQRTQGSVLIIDVGGGTTDFSLIRLQRRDATIAARRVAVGRHLLLGGDNLDLALAQRSEARLLRGEPKLSPTLFAQLVHQCRLAKESLLAGTEIQSCSLILTEPGARLVGQLRKSELSRIEVEQTLLEGFLPRVERHPALRQRGALLGFGLPYEVEPAITRHLAQFLGAHLPDEPPVAVLLNGGLFNAACARSRVEECLCDWYGKAPLLLTTPNLDAAVAQGAACYGLAILGHGRRVSSGTSEAYFVGIESQDQERRAVCVLPRGTQEGERHLLVDRVFELTLGQPIRFDLFSANAANFRVGQVVEIEPAGLTALHPLCTVLPGNPDAQVVRVQLEGELSATGLIDLACVPLDADGAQRAHLSFEVKGAPARRAVSAAPRPVSAQWELAKEALERVYGKVRKDVKERESRDLLRNLERQLGLRNAWPLELNRQVVDLLLDYHGARTRSPDHERLFWLLSGYCLRPGTGAPRDEQRAVRYGELLLAPLRFKHEVRNWQQYWIAVRRTCAGLSEATQCSLKESMALIASGSSKRPTMPAAAAGELLEAASWLERLPPRLKLELGTWLLERTWSERDPKLWEGVARLGSRIPAYSSLHYVLAPHLAEAWLDELLREKWSELDGAVGHAVSLARYTGDRSRDISDAKRQQVLQALTRASAPESALLKVREWVPVEEQERRAWLGDDLPQGLRLVPQA